MKNILDRIIETKRAEVGYLKTVTPPEKLKDGEYFRRSGLSLKNSLQKADASGIIAEFKQKSPSKGEINYSVKVEEVTRGYADAGACGISVLTDFEFFGGTLINLLKARDTNPGIPLLRKDFIIDEYQIIEAKAYGADVILLIAACLEKSRIEELAGKAKELDLEVLLEIHDEQELEKICPMVDLVGVNNRNLKTFEVGIETSIKLAPLIPDQFVRISESGLSSVANIQRLKICGYEGFLIGETFMKTSDPAGACKSLIADLRNI